MVAFLVRLSDSSRLLDKQYSKRGAVVRFFAVIGQAALHTRCACPILRGYRTTSASYALRLSDFLPLSDKQRSQCIALVRFFAVIGQPVLPMRCACPILRGYRTTSAPNALPLSDSSRLSDNQRSQCVALVRFFAADHFCLFIDVRADDPDKDRHQQDDREQPDEMDGGYNNRVRLKSCRQDGHIRQSAR